MSMYNDYTFKVKAKLGSAQLSYQSGRASTTRIFLVTCDFAEELALRLLGKFYQVFPETEYLTPVLPAPFPFDTAQNRNVGQMNMVATGFTINPISPCCFNVYYTSVSDVQGVDVIHDPTSYAQLEKYFYHDLEEEISNKECMCEVVVTYEENPCDCLNWDSVTSSWEANAEILPGTCVSVERNPSYEMFTLPNANLVWKNIKDSKGNQVQLKADSYVYQVIPKADIIVHWHNVPVRHLASIEKHLQSFRGKVNQEEWGESVICPYVDDELEPPNDIVYSYLYEPETILFIDWQEDRSRRTDAFGDNQFSVNMNTTTLKLFFKQKRVEIDFGESGSDASVSDDDAGIAGWNHMFTDNDTMESSWMRVVVKSTQNPIFPLTPFSNILYPDPLP